MLTNSQQYYIGHPVLHKGFHGKHYLISIFTQGQKRCYFVCFARIPSFVIATYTSRGAARFMKVNAGYSYNQVAWYSRTYAHHPTKIQCTMYIVRNDCMSSYV